MSNNPLHYMRASDIRGIAKLATQAAVGVTHIAEGVHQSVWSTIGVSGGDEPGQTGGITGMVYRTIRGVTQLVGSGIDNVLESLQPLFETAEDAKNETPQREAVFAALNGVMGDHLAASSNPFAIPMTLRYRGETLNLQALPPMPEATGKVLLLIHGLCMNDQHWHAPYKGIVGDHGGALASALGFTPVYLRFNSGLHISQNGRSLSVLLEQLVTQWPTPVEKLTVVAHSMGGLLIRSAFHQAKEEALRWPDQLKEIVFLGTPHHGAPLEQAGNWVDKILASTPYTAPFAKFGHLRSAGITDLRHGHILDEDRQDDRFHRGPDSRPVVPLPEGVACYTVAATLADKRSALANRLIGDGLVPLHSALGQHDDPRRILVFAKTSQRIAYRTNHRALLSSPEVAQQMVQWLTPAGF